MRPTSCHLRDYNRWKAKAEGAGFLANIGSYGYTDGIEFRSEPAGDPFRSFWIGCRELGVILHLPRPEAIYRVTDVNRVGDLCLALLTRMRGHPGVIVIDPYLVREYGLRVITTMEWHAAEQEERNSRYAVTGWRPLDPQDENAVSERFAATFFREGGGLIGSESRRDH